MDTVVIRVRDLPYVLPATTVDGTLRWDPIHLQVVNSANATVDLDVAGATWALTVSDAQGGTAELSKTTAAALGDSGVYVENATTGTVHICVEDSDVTTLGAGVHWYDVKVTIPAAHAYMAPGTYCLLQGTLTITEDAAG